MEFLLITAFVSAFRQRYIVERGCSPALRGLGIFKMRLIVKIRIDQNRRDTLCWVAGNRRNYPGREAITPDIATGLCRVLDGIDADLWTGLEVSLPAGFGAAKWARPRTYREMINCIALGVGRIFGSDWQLGLRGTSVAN